MMDELSKNYKIVIEIKPAELKNIMLKYYKQLYNEQVISLKIESGKQYVGLYESPDLYTKIILKRRISINGFEAILEEQIDNDKIKEILNQYLEDHNYEVGKFNFETRRRSIGMYGDEQIYFDCLKIEVKQKEKQKVKTK